MQGGDGKLWWARCRLWSRVAFAALALNLDRTFDHSSGETLCSVREGVQATGHRQFSFLLRGCFLLVLSCHVEVQPPATPRTRSSQVTAEPACVDSHAVSQGSRLRAHEWHHQALHSSPARRAILSAPVHGTQQDFPSRACRVSLVKS